MKTAEKVLVIIYKVLAVIIVAAAAILLVLMLFGIHPYAVRTASMEPEIGQGSICFVNRRLDYEEVREGDIITYKMGEMLVTHRAVSIDSEGITTKGDANNTNDASKVTKANYVGRTLFSIPLAGKPVLFAQTATGRIIFIGAFALFVLAGIVYDIVRTRREKAAGECSV